MSDVEVGRFALRTFRIVWQSDVDWDNGVCEAVCIKRTESVYSWGGNLLGVLQDQLHDPAVPKHDAPFEGCTCGIYGTLDVAALMRQYWHNARHLITVIAAEGRTIIGPVGLRTARARVVAYWTPTVWLEQRQEALREAEYYCQLPEMLNEYHLPMGKLSNASAARLGLRLPEKDTECY